MWKIREDLLNHFINTNSSKTFQDLQDRINYLEVEIDDIRGVKVSGYNTFDECQTTCICPKCSARGKTCGPCIDCTGELDTDDGGVTNCNSLKEGEKSEVKEII